MFRPALAALIALALSACSPPGLLNGLNNLTPGDGGVDKVASGIAYGADPRQALDVFRPHDRAKGHPVLIFFYGGGWAKGSRRDYGFAARAYAARGFVVVLPDYRLVPQVRFPGFLQDGAAAVRWTRDHIAEYGGDPARISLGGHSAGAYNAVMLALDTRWLRGAGVNPKIVRATAALAGPYDFYPWDSPRAIEAMGQAPDPRATQPINFVRADAPPLWLGYGSADKTVKPRNSVVLAKALKAKGAEVVAREYPGMSHEGIVMALSKPFRGKGPVLAESADFLKAHSR